ncbi:MAG: metal ABC transporter solute-binding protein, Zn/Mn family, partial [Pseudomonadota bacterium]
VDLGVPAVFVESTINPRTIQAVIDGAADRGHEVVIGGELYSDAMGAPGTAEGTYIGMMHANTMKIVTALGGEPARWPAELQDWAEQWSVDVAVN